VAREKDGGWRSPLLGNKRRPKVRTSKEMHIEVVRISSLKPYKRNARVHSPNQIRELAESMKKFGVTMPVLIDRNGVIVAGHARLEALKLLGRTRVHVIRLENLTEAQVRAYRLADNKLADNSSWDVELLGIELRELAELDVDCNFSIPGFQTGEIDFLIQNFDQGNSDESVNDLVSTCGSQSRGDSYPAMKRKRAFSPMILRHWYRYPIATDLQREPENLDVEDPDAS
jgi:hypothetical protein